ncbi:hypothetical protein H0H93_005459 [Arthromyces matolae]|nr:hypothetical protein H0H93_005459 [Arthromyces matolae]
MIFKTNLIQTVTIACILHVALAVPILHDTSPDQTTTPFSLENQLGDVASRAFEASQNLMTHGESNLPGSLSPVNHGDFSIRTTLNPRSPVGDSSQQPSTGNVPSIQRIPTQQRRMGLIASRTSPKLDLLADALEKKEFSISEPLRERWKEYLEKLEGLQPLHNLVFCAALKNAEMQRKHLMSQHQDGEIGPTAKALLSDTGDTLDPDTRKASKAYVDLIDQIPSPEALALCADNYHALAVEEFTKADGLLMEGWRLRKDVLSEMDHSTTCDKSELRKILLNQIAVATPYATARDNLYTRYVTTGANIFIRALTPMVKHCNETGNGAKRPAQAGPPADHPPKRPALDENGAQTGN